MAQRKSIVFPFYNSYFTSTAIIIYQTNIIRTLMRLPDEKKPELVIWHNKKSPVDEIRDIQYPYIKFIDITSSLFRFRKLVSMMLGRIGMGSVIKFNSRYDAIYPAYPDDFLNGIEDKIYWKADFQENYYPQYFTAGEMNWVKIFFDHLRKNPTAKLVLSSYDSWNDLKKFYPDIKNPVILYRFVSHLPPADNSRLMEIKDKFGIDKPYYIVCNQFWPHKNHKVIIEALSVLKKDFAELPFKFVFTGKTSSIRGNDYFEELRTMMQDSGVADDIIITGFMERDEQILLMKNSLAVVQPTLFEGWSTVIEDSKALNHYVIASDLAVNMEQVDKNITFFKPHDAAQLADILKKHQQNPPAISENDYNENIKASVEDVKKIFDL